MKKTSKTPKTGVGSTALVVDAGRGNDCQETTRWVREWYSHEHARWYPLIGRRVPKTLPLRWVEVVERRTVVKEEGARSTTDPKLSDCGARRELCAGEGGEGRDGKEAGR
jgi:hypothetical protein